MKNENKQKVIDFLNQQKLDGNIDFNYHLGDSDFENYDDIYQILDDAGALQVDIIYYASAMQYLTQNDTSLNESLSIASDMGYKPKNLNSEILASLLATENLRNDFSQLEEEINDLINELLEEENEEEEETE